MNAPPEDTPTRVGGRYRLDERIGAGAMGAVWRATDELLDRTVAVKELLAAAAPPTAAGVDALEESRQRILREGRIGARLQHPHVISMFDVVVHDDRPWLVMEYLPSRSLAQVLSEKGPMEPREAAEVGRQVADGLAAAHVAGVVHRDVKPGNVLIASDGRVKLTDFGVSRAVDDVQLTRTGLIAGTPAFLSPEVARGQAPTAASDVFALGATLYAAVEGHPPFGLDDNAYALLHKVAGGIVEPPRQAGPLTGVMMRLLAADPADRPSAAQARDALAAVAAGRAVGAGTGATTTAMMAAPVPPRPAPASEYPDHVDAEPPERRSRVPLILGVIALLVLGGGVVAAILAGQSGNGAVPPAPSTTTAAAPTTGARSTTTPAPTSAPTTTATTTTTAPPSSSDSTTPTTEPVAFVQNYYGLLPGNTGAAFALLSPQAQSASGGRSGFENFYAGIRSVSVQDAQQTGDNTVSATVVFQKTNGTITSEPYRFVMTTDAGGSTIMQSFSPA